MSGDGKFAFWLVLLFGAGIAVPVATGLVVYAVLAPPDQALVLRIFNERLPLFVFGAAVLFGLCVGLVRWFFADYVLPRNNFV